MGSKNLYFNCNFKGQIKLLYNRSFDRIVYILITTDFLKIVLICYYLLIMKYFWGDIDHIVYHDNRRNYIDP